MKPREERIKEQEKLLKLQKEVEEELRKIPGVVSVGIGFKVVGGQRTEDITFRVYVREKKNKKDISPGEIIPAKIKGIQTDVIQYVGGELLVDTSEERPLKGGIQIQNDAKHSGAGTLGCFARRRSDGKTVLLSNHHVLFSDGAEVGDEVGQPDVDCCCCCKCNIIGKIVAGVNGNTDARADCAIAEITCDNIGEFVISNTIKALRTDPGGNPIDVRIRGVAQRVSIGDPPRIAVGDRVFKRGRTTEATSGIVDDINFPITCSGIAYNTQILILPAPGVANFAEGGDSGSILLNEDDEVVGLVFCRPFQADGVTPTPNGVANHIEHVLNALNIDIFSSPIAVIAASTLSGPALLLVDFDASGSSDTDGTIINYAWDFGEFDIFGKRETATGVTTSHLFVEAGTYTVTLTVTDNNGLSSRATVEIEVTPGPAAAAIAPSSRIRSLQDFETEQQKSPLIATFEKLRERFEKIETGRKVLALVNEHREEVVRLVNNDRRVMVTWQRKQGPAFLAAFMKSGQDPEYKIPKEINGVSLGNLLQNMAVVLEEHGSAELSAVLNDYSLPVLNLLRRCDTIEDIMQKIESGQFTIDNA